MRLRCYAFNDFAPKLVPASFQREWMDSYPGRWPYNCLPLPIANAHGWEVLCPVPFEITWNGGPDAADLTVRLLKPHPAGPSYDGCCRSHFGGGIATMYVGYIFKTDPDWDLLATGPFNRPKDNAYPLTGIMETAWLSYPFTMNWQLLRPGTATFEEDEPFCSIFPIRRQALVDCEPEIHWLADDPELERHYRQGFAARAARQVDDSPDASPWTHDYLNGRFPDGSRADAHVRKLRLKEPIDRRTTHSPREHDAAGSQSVPSDS
jgi:hypothetical protein